MQRAKAFFLVSAGLFLLALAYHFGAMSAQAQGPGNPVVASIPCGVTVVTANGDVYSSNPADCPARFPFQHIGNVFSGGPVSAKLQTWGQLKTQYRK